MKIVKIIDNNRVLLLDTIKNISSEYDELSIATGYWDLQSIDMLLEQIKGYKKIRLLIGREPLIPRHQLNDPEPDYPERDIFKDLEALTPNEKLKETIISIKDLISKGVLEVRVYKKSFLHAKCYIFGNFESSNAIGIIGSSNFTGNGLTKNTELNALENDSRIVTYEPKNDNQEVGHLYWFDEFWNESEEWNHHFTEILEYSPVGDMLFSPYEMYIKTLYELYKEELEEVELVETSHSRHELMEFQKRNVQQLIRKLNKFKTAMLSDSVGLGKTITAIGVIKQYIDSKEGRKRVAIICPKSLTDQWESELTGQGLTNVTPITLQNSEAIQKERNLDNIASVSLFVIDESHNLRKSNGKRYEQLLDWIKNNKQAHVLLLTATPINNELKDLTNQILLGTRGRGDIIQITIRDSKSGQTSQVDFVQAIENLQRKITRQSKQEEEIDYENIKQVMAPIIRSVVVRRTRQGIEKEYGHLTIDEEKKSFPKAIPENYQYNFESSLNNKILNLDAKVSFDVEKLYQYDPQEIVDKCTDLKHPLDQLDKLTEDSTKIKTLLNESPIYFIFQLILMLGFIPYRWRLYQRKYYGKTVEEIKALKLTGDESRDLQQQRGIYGIFRTMYLKRMESSVEAISKSLRNYKEKLEQFNEALEKHHEIVGVKDLEVLKDALKMIDIDESLDDPSIIGEESDMVLDKVNNTKYNLEAFSNDIKKEFELIDIILKELKLFKNPDSKLNALIDLLKKLDKEKLAGEKVLIFSYFADTINYLEKNIFKLSNGLLNESNTAFVSTKNRNDSEILAKRFSPIAKGYTLNNDEIRYLFSTDILSEGQNLQDAGIIINYDLHWNPVRMIQRNGRINRIGSNYENVYIYNMRPEFKLELYLKLVKRLESKIEMISNTIGSDQSVLGEVENPIDFVESIKDLYSDDEQKRIQALTTIEEKSDLLMAEDDFILDLKSFEKSDHFPIEYKKSIYDIPLGKWGVIPSYKTNYFPVMVLSHLLKDDTYLYPQFIGMDKDSANIHLIPYLEALNILKTEVTDNERFKDNISVKKESIVNKASDIEAYTFTPAEESAKGLNIKLLRLMSELNYDIEDIEIVDEALNTKNYHEKRNIIKLVRKISRSQKENKPYYDDLTKLIIIARDIKDNKEEPILPNNVKQILYYVSSNK